MAILRKNIEETHLHTAILSFGGNLGNVKKLFSEAAEMLGDHSEVHAVSSYYETEAWGMADAPSFLNQVIILNTKLLPAELMGRLLDIEKKLGRIRDSNNKEGYRSRPIDIDILFYDDLVISEKDLEIPHPRLHLRKFVLEPLNEIVPEWIHPVFKKSIRKLRIDLDDDSEVKRII